MSKKSSVTLTNRNGEVIISVFGDFGYSVYSEFHEILNQIFENTALTMDLTHCHHISSSGLGMLLELRKKTYISGKKVKIIGCGKNLKEVFVTAHFNELFSVV